MIASCTPKCADPLEARAVPAAVWGTGGSAVAFSVESAQAARQGPADDVFRSLMYTAGDGRRVPVFFFWLSDVSYRLVAGLDWSRRHEISSPATFDNSKELPLSISPDQGPVVVTLQRREMSADLCRYQPCRPLRQTVIQQ